MKFKRIDEDTVCCIVTEYDMINNGLEVDDFIQNREKVQDFLHTIVEQAEEEVGYEMKNGVLSMQVAMLPEHNLAITFTEKEDIGVREMLDQLRKAVTEVEEQASTGDFLHHIEEHVSSVCDFLELDDEHSTDSSKTKSNTKKNARHRRVSAFAFTSMSDLIQCCKKLPREAGFCKSALYRYKNQYRMLINNYALSERDYGRICTAMVEFGKCVSDKEEYIAAVKEHGKSLIARNAVKILQTM